VAFNLFNITRQQKRLLALSLVVTAALYLGFVIGSGFDHFSKTLSRLGFSGWIILLGCSFSNYLLRFLRWDFYLTSLQHHLPRGLHFSYYLAGFALTTTPGKAGETIRSLYLKVHHVPYSHSLASFFTERFLDLIVITLLASLMISSTNTYGGFIALVLLTLLGLLPLMQSRLPLLLFSWLGTRFSHRRIGKLSLHLGELLNQARELLRLRKLYTGILLGGIAWVIQALAFHYLLSINDAAIPITTSFAIYALSLLAGALSFIPGGIGATEAVMSLLLVSHGVDKQTALIIPIINRVSTLWFAVLLGLISNSWLGLQGMDINRTKNK